MPVQNGGRMVSRQPGGEYDRLTAMTSNEVRRSRAIRCQRKNGTPMIDHHADLDVGLSMNDTHRDIGCRVSAAPTPRWAPAAAVAPTVFHQMELHQASMETDRSSDGKTAPPTLSAVRR
mgnify:CR=1 FL=1